MAFELLARGIRKSFGGVEVLHGVDLEASGGSVLALLGENGAGKSTLVKIIAGDQRPDGGELLIDAEAKAPLDTVRARRLGIRMISQEIADAPTLTVAENVGLGQMPTRRGLVDWKQLHRQSRQMLKELDVNLDTRQLVGDLRIGQRQMVEIARELNRRARCLIMDEPTAALSNEEVERLFSLIRQLRQRGVAIIYITHRLDEVPAIADRVQVLRDGESVLVRSVAGAKRSELVQAMVGRAVADVGRPAARTWPLGREPAVRLREATSKPAFQGVNLEVYPGEVLALYGKLGSGAAEITETLFGVRHLDEGRLEIMGRPVSFRDPKDAIGAGVGYLPADRQAEGAFLVRSVAENLSAPSWPRLARLHGLITAAMEAAAARRWRDTLHIRSRNDPSQLLGTLSGGNQQKVLLGRWLEHASRVLALVEPTRGVDVGARQDVYKVLRTLAERGVAIVVSTSDYEEVVQVADRVMVVARGKPIAELAGAEIRTESLIAQGGR